MTLRLRVDTRRWRDHLRAARGAHAGGSDALVPVVKGNGYGFGRDALFAECTAWGVAEVAVGTVYEVPARTTCPARPVVLTPMGAAAPLPERDDAVLTVSGPEDLDLLVRHGSPHQVMVKLRSSMHRFGVTADEVADLLTAVDRRLPGGVAGAALHLPLATTQDENRRQIEAWLRLLPPGIGLSVSHLDDATWRALTAAHPDRALRRRMGTALWHGDKSMLHLEADVLAVHTVAGGEPVGYRQGPAPAGGVVVLVGCGSAHGVAPLDDGRSPFHHARRRLPLLEPPHMHTSMLFVAADDPVAPPGIGDWIDVQRPLTGTAVDTVDWR